MIFHKVFQGFKACKGSISASFLRAWLFGVGHRIVVVVVLAGFDFLLFKWAHTSD